MHIARGEPVIITIQERRSADGLDAHIPIILRDGALYDADLDRFLLDLPLNGVRSPHSLRAYGYDVVVWVRFLAEACGKTVWLAECADVAVFHRARRRADAGFRISAASWNRASPRSRSSTAGPSSEGLVAATRLPTGTRGAAVTAAAVPALLPATMPMSGRRSGRMSASSRWRTIGRFRDVGLRGLTADGAERPGARDRNGARNASVRRTPGGDRPAARRGIVSAGPESPPCDRAGPSNRQSLARTASGL